MAFPGKHRNSYQYRAVLNTHPAELWEFGLKSRKSTYAYLTATLGFAARVLYVLLSCRADVAEDDLLVSDLIEVCCLYLIVYKRLLDQDGLAVSISYHISSTNATGAAARTQGLRKF